MPHSLLVRSCTFEELTKIINRGNGQMLREALTSQDIQLFGKDGTTILHVAATTNNPEVVRELLRHRRLLPLLDKQDWSGTTALMAAVNSNCPQTVEVLCRCGADLTKTTVKTGETALHLACHLPSNIVAQILLEYNTSAAFINQTDSSGDTALSQSVRYGSSTFYTLLEAGASICIQNPDNKRTVLHLVVAYNRKSMMTTILHNPEANNSEFYDIQDVKGDTALMIAVKLDRIDFIRLLTKYFRKLNGVNLIESESILHIAISHNRADILTHLLKFTSSSSNEFCDSNFRTPVMYAAELDRADCFRELIEYGANNRVKNLKTGETLLHIIAKYHSNACLPIIMALSHISWFCVQKDYDGNTPYMSAIISGNDVLLHETFKVKRIDLTEYNYEGETATFYAIKQGYLKVLITLLLSPKYYEFAYNNQNKLNLKDTNVILQSEICGDIYATDVYILSGIITKYPLVSYFPPNLLIRTRSGKNVFHACALGGSLECLRLLFDFYQLFAPKSVLVDFDSPEKFGVTPLLYAAQCSGAFGSCVYFLATHGANLVATDKEGLSVIEAILLYNPEGIRLLTKLLNHCVSSKKEHYYSDLPNISIDYGMLCPKGENQMAVIATLFKYVTGRDRNDVLQHPVVVTLLRKKASAIKYLFYFRFISSIIVATVISTLIPIIYIHEHTPKERFGPIIAAIMKILFPLMILLCIINSITKLPMIINREMWTTDYVAFFTTISIIVLFICGRTFHFVAELSAIVILSCWMTVLTFAINMYSNFNYQIAVYFRLVFSISKRFLLLVLIIFIFSVSFFCIYHNDKRFNNIIFSFMYAFTVLLPGFLGGLPTFSSDYFQNTTDKFHFCVECFIIGCFVIVVIIGFTNMLVGLAVRSGQDLEIDGYLFQHYHVTHYITELEFWFTSKVYYWLVKLNVLKCLKKMKHEMKIKLVQYVYDKESKVVCDPPTMQKFRKILSEDTEEEEVN